MKLYKNKALWSFVAGAFAATKGVDMLMSQKAKSYYANWLASGMIAHDDLRTCYEDIKKEALDIREEADSVKANKLKKEIDE